MEKGFEKIAGIPAVLLDISLDTTKKLLGSVKEHKHFKRARQYWHDLGPGLTTGAADDDPSGIATYSQAGAGYGFQLLWLAPFTFPLMAVVQEMCARLGLVTGQGLAANIKTYYPKWMLYLCTTLLFIANSLNIGADLGAMAKGVQLLFPNLSYSLLVIVFTFACLGLQIFISYEKYAKYLKYLALVLLSYVFSAIIVQLDWHQLLKSAVIPSFTFSKNQLLLICAVLGTTISPYLFFWQTSQEVEEEILKGKHTVELRRGTTDQAVKKMRLDVWSGMFLSNLVMFSIVAVCAAVLFPHGINNINTASDAAIALRPLAGNQAYLLFALGIIGTGLLAVPVLAGSASYAISESFGWRFGLYNILREAYSFYGVIIISMLIGLSINFIGLDPIKALIYSAVGNGLIAPIVLVFIVLMSSNKIIMGKRVNNSLTTIVGWAVVGLMGIAGLAVILSIFS